MRETDEPRLGESVVPLHDLIVLLDLLLDVRQFALQVLAALLLLEESGVLGNRDGDRTFNSVREDYGGPDTDWSLEATVDKTVNSVYLSVTESYEKTNEH